MRRLGLLVVVMLGTSIALAPAAHAAAFELITKPVDVRGYSFYLQVDRPNYGGPTVQLTLVQRRGHSRQRYGWFKGRHKVSVTLRPRLRGAHVRVTFEHAGHLDMIFSATGSTVHRPARGCRFTNSWAPGRLTGLLVLRTGPGRFGTIVLRHLTGRLVHASALVECRTFGGGGGLLPEDEFETPKLTVPLPHGALIVAHVERETVAHMYAVRYGDRGQDGIAREEISREIVGRAPRRQFSYRADWSSAHLGPLLPYFRGALTFTSTGPRSGDPSLEVSRPGVVRGRMSIRRAAPNGIVIKKRDATISTESP